MRLQDIIDGRADLGNFEIGGEFMDHHRKLMGDYIGGKGTFVNAHLRGNLRQYMDRTGYGPEDLEDVDMEGMVRGLDDMFSDPKAFHETTEPSTVYRVMPAEHLKNAVGRDLHDPGYLSTAASVGGAQHLIDDWMGGKGQSVMQLHLPTGTRVLNVNQMSRLPEEEILLNRGARLRVHDLTPRRITLRGDSRPRTFHVARAELIGHE